MAPFIFARDQIRYSRPVRFPVPIHIPACTWPRGHAPVVTVWKWRRVAACQR